MEQRGRSPGNGDAAWNLGEMVSAQAEKILFEDREIAQMDPRPFIRRRIEEQEYLGLVRLGYTHLLEQYLKPGRAYTAGQPALFKRKESETE